MLVILVIGLLIVAGFVMYWFVDDWYWPLVGRGANPEELVSFDLYRLHKTLYTGAKLWQLQTDHNQTGTKKLLFLLGLNASARHKTQYLIASAFVEQGYSVYLLDYASVCCPTSVSPNEASWRTDILAAFGYLLPSYVVARSMACPLLLDLLLQHQVVEPDYIAMITPVVSVDDFVLTCCTRQCKNPGLCLSGMSASSSSVKRCVVYYFEADFLMHPLCRAENVVYVKLDNNEECNVLDVHCRGPCLYREYIASHFKQLTG